MSRSAATFAAVLTALVVAAPAFAAEGFPPAAVAFRPGSAGAILVLDASRRPRLYDFTDPAQPKLATTLPSASAATFLSADTIATGHEDGMIRRWRPDGQPAGAPVKASAKGIEAIVLSRSGRLIGSLDFDHALTLWTPAFARRADPLRKAERCEFKAEPRVWDIAFRPDDSMAVVSTGCGNLAAWSAQGRPVAVPKPRDAPLIFAFAFAADGATMAAHFQAHPGAYNFIFPATAGRLGPARAVPAPLFNTYAYDILPARGGGFLFAGEGGIVRVSAAGAKGTAIAFEGIRRIAVSGDGKRIAVLGESRLGMLDEAGKLLGEVKLPPAQ